MNIRRAISADRDVLFDVWLRSVRATHTFVSEEDLQFFIPLVRNYLASAEPEFWVLCSDSGTVMGFMGMSGSKMDALFLAPEQQRQGGGWRLVRHAQDLHGELTVDVVLTGILAMPIGFLGPIGMLFNSLLWGCGGCLLFHAVIRRRRREPDVSEAWLKQSRERWGE